MILIEKSDSTQTLTKRRNNMEYEYEIIYEGRNYITTINKLYNSIVESLTLGRISLEIYLV